MKLRKIKEKAMASNDDRSETEGAKDIVDTDKAVGAHEAAVE